MKFLKILPFFIVVVVSCGLKRELSLQERQGPYFWLAEKEGKNFHILGTMHIGVSIKDLQCSDKITAYLKSSDLIFTEFSPSKMPLLQREITRGLNDSARNSYQALNEKSRQFLKKINFPGISALSYYGFLYVLHRICVSHDPDLVEKFALFNSSSLDKQIQETAQSQNIKQDYLDSLETITSIFKLNMQAVTSEQVEGFVNDYDIICSEANFEKAVSVLSITADRFKSGDLSLDFVEKLEKQQGPHKETPRPGFPPLNDEIVADTMQSRNEKWVKKLVSAQADHSNIFVAGGLFHFKTDGKRVSALDGLKKEGFSVSRMNSACEIKMESKQL